MIRLSQQKEMLKYFPRNAEINSKNIPQLYNTICDSKEGNQEQGII